MNSACFGGSEEMLIACSSIWACSTFDVLRLILRYFDFVEIPRDNNWDVVVRLYTPLWFVASYSVIIGLYTNFPGKNL